MGILPNKAVSVVIFAAFVALSGAGVWVAWSCGAVAGYLGFAWVIPLSAVLWWNYEYEMFGSSPLNTPFILTLVWGSFLLSVVCFPVLVVTLWGRMTVLTFLGLAAGALLNGIPAWFRLQFWLHPPRSMFQTATSGSVR